MAVTKKTVTKKVVAKKKVAPARKVSKPTLKKVKAGFGVKQFIQGKIHKLKTKKPAASSPLQKEQKPNRIRRSSKQAG